MKILLGIAVPALLGAASVVYLDLRGRRLGLDPPGFREPARRLLGLTTLALVLALASFAWLGGGGGEPSAEQRAQVPTWQLFSLHLLLLAAALVWFAAGYAGSGESLRNQLGLGGGRRLREIGLGVLFGVGAWMVVIVGAALFGAVLTAFGAKSLLPDSPSSMVAWLAGKSLLLRAGLALSAGVVEEIFFRGLLQPRAGLLVSTGLFAMAHMSYGQPFMLVGITLLSLLYGLLVVWRQSLWAAITAHAVFDLVQLLIVVPSVLRSFQGFWGA